ncbi:hypothetical protein E3T25_04725 [Cryobacterium sandaracinum]|uniref:Apea-like HEPN domain-containing protein n=1 Tax=Cryobacterium sandaracinum TaxID=1259247 RepID=A0ABY2JII9_9MICO|nr:hypothetical protein [Cryobacterium sandaracinum]TFD04823.1 hypothetical protein E3T25_04725 [Cryobacterium sandaracinum]
MNSGLSPAGAPNADNTLVTALGAAVKRLNQTLLRDFAGPIGDVPYSSPMFRPSSPLVDVSELAEIVLLAAGGIADPWFEKTRWSVSFSFDGVDCRMRHTNLGVRIDMHSQEGADTDELGARIEERLTKAVHFLNSKVVAPAITAQIDRGAARVQNQYERYRGMVNYFTSKLDDALVAHAEVSTDSPTTPTGGGSAESAIVLIERLMAAAGQTQRREHEIAYLATALVAGYFSYLQHVLILLSGFSRKALEPEFRLVNLLGSRWADQFSIAYNDVTEPETNQILSDLKRLANDYRNPLLHGSRPEDGILAEWAPGRFSLVTRDGRLSGDHYLWKSGLALGDAHVILGTIGKVDAFLDKHPYWGWVESGCPVPFDPESVARAIHEAQTGNAGRFTAAADDAYAS